jgi:hypothetical protein
MKFSLLLLFFATLIGILSCTSAARTPAGSQQTTGNTGNSNAETNGDELQQDGNGSGAPHETDGSSGAESGVSTDGETAPTDNDGVTATSPGALPQGWPEDVPVMEGFTILNVTYDEKDGIMTGGITVSAQGNASFDEIIGFYTHLEGWSSTSENSMVTSDEKGFFVSTTKGPSLLMVNGANQEADGSVGIVLTYIPSQG